MLRFRCMRSLQKFAAVHSSVHNHFNHESQLYFLQNFKPNRAVALGQWRQLCSGKVHAVCGKLRLVRIRLTAPYSPSEQHSRTPTKFIGA